MPHSDSQKHGHAPHASEASAASLVALLDPVLAHLAALKLTDPASAASALNAKYPAASKPMREIAALFARGVKDGWLCDREHAGTRFSRAAKPSPQTRNFSIDAVTLSGPGGWHRHTSGEIDLCFAADGEPTFDGHAPGWVVFAPGSDHVPTVEGGTMHILYFLPGGQVEWKRG
jgi:hypothetical protein